MSQHLIDALSTDHKIVVGYDRPLNDFFATVFNAASTDEVVLWVPTAPTPEAMAERIAQYAIVPPTVLATLRAEQRNRATHPMHKVVDHRAKA